MFDPDAASVLNALEAFMQVLTSNAEDAGLDALLETELTFSQARAIMALGRAGEPLPINELADRIHLSVASAGRNVEQLVQAGLVDRAPDDTDRRVKRVSLSDQGRRQISQFLAAKRGCALQILQRLDPEDRVRLLAAFTPVLAKLGAASPACEP